MEKSRLNKIGNDMPNGHCPSQFNDDSIIHRLIQTNIDSFKGFFVKIPVLLSRKINNFSCFDENVVHIDKEAILLM